MSLASAAIAYARAGRKVFPCRWHGKEPIIEHGFMEASLDPAVAEAWWGKWPDANIGMACSPSGFFAVDIDPRNGGGETWTKIVEEGYGTSGVMVPETREAETGSGGWHFLFNLPPLPEGRSWKGKLGPGVDLKVNGYIIVAPSIHPNGSPYRWTNKHGLADAPQWLLELAWHKPATVTASPVSAELYERAPWFCKAALDKECERMAAAAKGERNRTLNSAAFNLGGLVSLGLSRELIEERLLEAACTRAGLPLPEATKTVNSGIKAGMKRPRGIPQRRGQLRR